MSMPIKKSSGTTGMTLVRKVAFPLIFEQPVSKVPVYKKGVRADVARMRRDYDVAAKQTAALLKRASSSY